VSRKLLPSLAAIVDGDDDEDQERGVPWEYHQGKPVQASRPRLDSSHFNQSMDASESDTNGASKSEIPLSSIPPVFLPIMRSQTSAC